MRARVVSGKRLVAALLLLTAAGCGGGGDAPPPEVPDLSGIWAGSWQGAEPGGLGQVSGTWEVEITQGESSASGPTELRGDIDCMPGQMQTDPDASSAVTGTVARSPCATVTWQLTALSVAEGSASGSWSNTGTGGGGFLSGTRIATLDGPRVRFVNPPGAKPNAIVTVSGLRLSPLAAGDGLTFNQTPQAFPLSADSVRIVARVPNIVTSGPVKVKTDTGTAQSPMPFNVDVTAPPVVLGNSTAAGSAPAALAVSPDGRKFYIIDRVANNIRVVHAATLFDMLPSNPTVLGVPRSVVASPDGSRIYVAAQNFGVYILDAANANGLDTIALNTINDETRDNPQGLAVSPDGTLLLVSEGASGGSVKLYRLSDKQELQSIPFGLGLAPLGVAFAPDGTRFYVAVADLTPAAGSLHVYDVQTGGLIDSESVGELPTALAVTPDGNLVHVTNKTDGTVSVYDTQTPGVVRTVTVGTNPVGIAISPDGARAYVANSGSASVSVFDTQTGSAVGSPLAVGTQPIAVAINSQGTTAYVSNVAGATPTVVEVGGMRTLTILRGGSGIGSVQSNPPGINCGTQCQAQFPAGTPITLTAVPGPNSTFSGWSGPGCGFSVTLDVNRTCTASFSSTLPPPSTTPPPWCTSPATTGCCFIATAAYGSDMAEDVMTLRRFRDDTLNASALGRGFVRLYYQYSPPLADYIRERNGVRAAVRVGLKPLVFAIRHPQSAAALTFALLLAVLGWRLALRRRVALRG